jgi:amidase
MDPRVATCVQSAAKKFEELGATVEEVSIPRHKIAPQIFWESLRLSSTMAVRGFQSGRRQMYFPDLIEKMFPITQEKADLVSAAALRT